MIRARLFTGTSRIDIARAVYKLCEPIYRRWIGGVALKGVILAGGTGSRLAPLTHYMNKHLLPVGPYPMIHYAIAKLRDAGISEILLIINAHSAQLYAEYLGSGEQFGVSLTYRIQDSAGGIAQAAALAESFVNGDKFALLLGDNLFADEIGKEAKRFEGGDERARVFLKKVDDPRAFGVPEFSPSGSIIRIEEKPEHPKSSYCVIGLYFYDSGVFDIVRKLKPSARGELEISDVNNEYAKRGQLSYSVLQGWWIDAGTHASIKEAADILQQNPHSFPLKKGE